MKTLETDCKLVVTLVLDVAEGFKLVVFLESWVWVEENIWETGVTGDTAELVVGDIVVGENLVVVTVVGELVVGETVVDETEVGEAVVGETVNRDETWDVVDIDGNIVALFPDWFSIKLILQFSK